MDGSLSRSVCVSICRHVCLQMDDAGGAGDVGVMPGAAGGMGLAGPGPGQPWMPAAILELQHAAQVLEGQVDPQVAGWLDADDDIAEGDVDMPGLVDFDDASSDVTLPWPTVDEAAKWVGWARQDCHTWLALAAVGTRFWHSLAWQCTWHWARFRRPASQPT